MRWKRRRAVHRRADSPGPADCGRGSVSAQGPKGNLPSGAMLLTTLSTAFSHFEQPNPLIGSGHLL